MSDGNFDATSFDGSIGGFDVDASGPVVPATYGPGGANVPLDPPREYDGRKDGEPWKAPAWAVEERERKLREANEKSLRDRLIREGKLRPSGSTQAAPQEAFAVTPIPVLRERVSIDGITVLPVPELPDDEAAILALLLSD